MADSSTTKITQEEIRRLMDLEEETKSARLRLQAKVMEKAEIEPGPLTAFMEKGKETKSVTKTLLVDKLGKNQADAVWAARGEREFERLRYGVTKEEIDETKKVMRAIEEAAEEGKGKIGY